MQPLPAPTESQKQSLRSRRYLRHPNQLALIEGYLRGETTSEDLAYDLLDEILVRAPTLEKELAHQAHERAEAARIEREMAENVTRDEPVFVVLGAKPDAADTPPQSTPVTTTAATKPASDNLNDVEMTAGPALAMAVEAESTDDTPTAVAPAPNLIDEAEWGGTANADQTYDGDD